MRFPGLRSKRDNDGSVGSWMELSLGVGAEGCGGGLDWESPSGIGARGCGEPGGVAAGVRVSGNGLVSRGVATSSNSGIGAVGGAEVVAKSAGGSSRGIISMTSSITAACANALLIASMDGLSVIS